MQDIAAAKEFYREHGLDLSAPSNWHFLSLTAMMYTDLTWSFVHKSVLATELT
jgi:hypothetical protein